MVQGYLGRLRGHDARAGGARQQDPTMDPAYYPRPDWGGRGGGWAGPSALPGRQLRPPLHAAHLQRHPQPAGMPHFLKRYPP